MKKGFISVLLLALTFVPALGQDDVSVAVAVGQTVNFFGLQATTLDGEAVEMPNFSTGKAYVIAFWHLGCVFCQSEGLLALQDEIYNVYNRTDLEAIALNADENADLDVLNQYAEERHIRYKFYSGGSRIADELAITVPSVLLIDRDGVLRYMDTTKTVTERLHYWIGRLNVRLAPHI